MAQEIKGVEIMRTGTFTPGGAARGQKVVIGSAELDAMVTSFNELVPIGGFTPVLKLGHAEAQRFMGQSSGAPNLGIVEKIWREGEKVLANFLNVPDAVVDLIRQKRFANVSVEVVPNLEFDGKTFSQVLTAVALLGAELPAVKGLKELAATLFTEVEVKPITADNIVSYEQETEPMTVTYTQEQHDALLEAAVSKAVDAAKATYAADAERLTAERDEAVEAVKTVKTKFAEYSDKVANAEAETMVDSAIKDGKLLPKQKDAAMAFMSNLTGTVTFGDEDKSMRVMFADFLGAMPTKIDTSEKGNGSTEDQDGNDYANAGLKVDELARKAMEGNDKLSYADARAKVLASDDELKAAYSLA